MQGNNVIIFCGDRLQEAINLESNASLLPKNNINSTLLKYRFKAKRTNVLKGFHKHEFILQHLCEANVAKHKGKDKILQASCLLLLQD